MSTVEPGSEQSGTCNILIDSENYKGPCRRVNGFCSEHKHLVKEVGEVKKDVKWILRTQITTSFIVIMGLVAGLITFIVHKGG